MMSSSTMRGARSIPAEVIVKHQEPGARPNGWARRLLRQMTSPLQRVTGFVSKTLVIAEFELRKIRHDPTELLTRAVQPALWLLVFGQVLGRARAIPTGGLPYLDFMAPGILAQSVLFIAIFHGIAIIWERDLGLVHKLLASPTPRRRWCWARVSPQGSAPCRRWLSFMGWPYCWASRSTGIPWLWQACWVWRSWERRVFPPSL